MLSIDIDPEKTSDTETCSPHLHWLFGGDREDYHASRLTCDDSMEDEKDNAGMNKVEAIIMGEVADFLQTHQCDDFWLPRHKQPQRVSSSTAIRKVRKSDLISCLQLASFYCSLKIPVLPQLCCRPVPKPSICSSMPSHYNC